MNKENIIISGGGEKLEESKSWKEFIERLNNESKSFPIVKDDNSVNVWSDEIHSRAIIDQYKKGKK